MTQSLKATVKERSSKSAVFEQNLHPMTLQMVTAGQRKTDWDGAEDRKGKEPAFVFTWVSTLDLKNKDCKPGNRRSLEVVTGQVFGHTKAMLTRHVSEIFGQSIDPETGGEIDLLKLVGIERNMFIAVDTDMAGTTNRLAGIAQDFEPINPEDFS